MIIPSYIKQQGKYKYLLTESFTINIAYNLGKWKAYSNTGKLLIECDNCKLTIHKDYAWDGATCAPTFKSILAATLVHDALIQVWHNGHDVSRLTIDSIFLDTMRLNKFLLRYLYYFAVRTYAMLLASRSYDGSIFIKTNLPPG